MKTVNLFLILLLISTSVFAAKKDSIYITWNDNKVIVKPAKASGIKLASDNGYLTITNNNEKGDYVFVLSGNSHDGAFTYKGKQKSSFVLNNLNISSKRGAALRFDNKKRTKIILKEGTSNSLANGNDTLHKACLQAKGDLTFDGTGNLSITSDVDAQKGIYTKKDLHIKNGNISVATTGNYSKIADGPKMPKMSEGEGPGMFGGPDSGVPAMRDSMHMRRPPMGGHGGPDFKGGPMGMPEEMKAFFDSIRVIEDSLKSLGLSDEAVRDSMRKRMGFPEGGPGGFGGPMGGGPEGEGGPGGFGGKHSYEGTCKAIKVMGKIVIDNGSLNLSTKTGGAEGLEGKEGITINGGNIYIEAFDDAINSNGKFIVNGGSVTAISKGNDAIDINGKMMFPMGGMSADTIAYINGGTVIAISEVGPPEEGLDCDENCLYLSGGTLFTGGAQGPGELNILRAKEDTQGYTKLRNIQLAKGKLMRVVDSKGNTVFEFTSPSSINSNFSIISAPNMKQGEKYSVVASE